MPKLSPREARKLWVSALRSGQYRQGVGKLKSKNGDAIEHCCLGVLCELYKKHEDPEYPEKGPEYSDIFYKYGPEKKMAIPPLTVTQWAGLHCSLMNKLIDLNDQRNSDETRSHAFDFNKIADVIEEAGPSLEKTDDIYSEAT